MRRRPITWQVVVGQWARLARPAVGWQVARYGFVLCAWLTLATTSQQGRNGPFSWGAFYVVPGVQWAAGPLTLLVPATLVGGLVTYGMRGAPQTWRWGWPGATCPVLVLVGVAGLQADRVVEGSHLVLSVAFFLGCYVWLVNFRPNLLPAIASLIVVHSFIAMAQFGLQHDLGLHWLGEPNLDPQQRGAGVIMADGVRWLRGYGLTGGPNILGWKLTLFMLWLWPHWQQSQGRQRLGLGLTLLIGSGGLFVSLSRSAWLGLAVGLGVSALTRRRQPVATRLSTDAKVLLGSLGLGLALFVWRFGAVVYGRFFNLAQPLEHQSLLVRWRDAGIALTLWRQHLWLGVGAGAYRTAAQAIFPVAHNVHNVPLRIGVELGVVGFTVWLLWLALPFRRVRQQPNWTAGLAPWSAMIVISLWQPGPSLYELQASLVLACLCAAWSDPAGASVG